MDEEIKKTERTPEEELAEIKKYMQPGLLTFISDMFDFLVKVKNEGRPMMFQVGIVNTGDGSKIGDFINVWAGIGDANPIKRIEQLISQRDVLKQFIVSLSKNHQLSREEIANMKLLLNTI